MWAASSALVLVLAGCGGAATGGVNSASGPAMSVVPFESSAGMSTGASPELSAEPQAVAEPAAAAPAVAPARGTAMAAALDLAVKGRAPMTGYSREQFGPAWADVDRNGCNTRDDMLRRYLTALSPASGCEVSRGVLQDPYTATRITYVRGGASEVDIDHVVAMGNAWVTGAWRWDYATRVAFANDPLNLLPVDAYANRQKGDGDAATWLPSNTSYRCDYVARQVAVKQKYALHVTSAERDAIVRVLKACPGKRLPPPGSAPTSAPGYSGAGPTTPTTPPDQPSGGGGKLDPRFATCTAAIAAGFGPYVKGSDAEYAWYIDRDRDGVACER